MLFLQFLLFLKLHLLTKKIFRSHLSVPELSNLCLLSPFFFPTPFFLEFQPLAYLVLVLAFYTPYILFWNILSPACFLRKSYITEFCLFRPFNSRIPFLLSSRTSHFLCTTNSSFLSPLFLYTTRECSFVSFLFFHSLGPFYFFGHVSPFPDKRHLFYIFFIIFSPVHCASLYHTWYLAHHFTIIKIIKNN